MGALRTGGGLAAMVLLCRARPGGGAVPEQHRWLSLAVFTVIGITLLVTYVAARRQTPADFYTAGGGISGIQNGWAIAGDYLSAASFLGIAGLISLWGYDGFMYSIGWLVAYISVLLLIAEPCRNIGKYTLSDILAYRNNPTTSRIVGALSVITVSTFYLSRRWSVAASGQDPDRHRLRGLGHRRRRGHALLRDLRRHGGDHLVQIIKAVLLVSASVVMVFAGLESIWILRRFFIAGRR